MEGPLLSIVDEALPPTLPSRKDYKIRIPTYKNPGEPDRYQLVAKQPRPARRQFPAQDVNFRLGTRYVSAMGAAVDPHPNVLQLRLRPSTVQRLIHGVLAFLPSFVLFWFKTSFPEWFLPIDIILKSQKENDEELFSNELRAYSQLRPVQGLLIPRLYGIIRYHGTRYMVLQHVGGVSLWDPEAATMQLREVSDLLQKCFSSLHSHGITQRDSLLGNFILVDGGSWLMAIDFEEAVFDYSAEEMEFTMKIDITDLVNSYKRMQYYYFREGFLEAA